jgi:hypothetical protein
MPLLKHEHWETCFFFRKKIVLLIIINLDVNEIRVVSVVKSSLQHTLFKSKSSVNQSLQVQESDKRLNSEFRLLSAYATSR